MWSYKEVCPHRGQVNAQELCSCEKHKNVLDAVTGRIVRVIGGERKPVYRTSELRLATSFADSFDKLLERNEL